MREINTPYTKKQNLLRQQEQIHFNTKCKNQNANSVRRIVPKHRG